MFDQFFVFHSIDKNMTCDEPNRFCVHVMLVRKYSERDSDRESTNFKMELENISWKQFNSLERYFLFIIKLNVFASLVCIVSSVFTSL